MATIQELTIQADRGNAEAMLTLAQSYAQGINGVGFHDNMATYWYQKAADRDPRYEIDLGVHY
jgi:TPR repeat protein